MSRSAFSRVVGASLTVVAMLALTGCTDPGSSQREWASVVQELDGVTSVDLTHYEDNWPSDGHYEAEIIVSPEFSEDQARTVAAESCEHDTTVTIVSISTAKSDGSEAGTVESFRLARQACIDSDSIVRFSQTIAALNSLGPGFSGSFDVRGSNVAKGIRLLKYVDDPASREAFHVVVEAADEASLLDALDALHNHIPDVQLVFTTSTGGRGGTLGPAAGTPVIAGLSPRADLHRLLPLARSALEIDDSAVIVSDGSLTVLVAGSGARDSSQVDQLRRDADDSGVTLTVETASFLGDEKKGVDE